MQLHTYCMYLFSPPKLAQPTQLTQVRTLFLLTKHNTKLLTTSRSFTPSLTHSLTKILKTRISAQGGAFLVAQKRPSEPHHPSLALGPRTDSRLIPPPPTRTNYLTDHLTHSLPLNLQMVMTDGWIHNRIHNRQTDKQTRQDKTR